MPGFDFSGVPRTTLAGRLARLPLRLIPADARVRILQGPLRGKRWIAGSLTHGAWLGSYELDKQAVFARRITPGSVVYDIGANVGLYTLLASTRAGPRGTVIAFEPAPRNVRYLREHIRLNSLTNIRIYEAAASDHAGAAAFDPADHPAKGHLTTVSTPTRYGPRRDPVFQVKLIRIDDLFEAGEIPRPTHIKIDVEGAEVEVLEGARRAISSGPRPAIFLATHSPELQARCSEILRAMGYTLTPIDAEPDNPHAEWLAE